MMNATRSFAGTIAAVAAAHQRAAGHVHAGPVFEVTDGTFDPDDWQTTILLQEGGADHTHEQRLVGGNPDAFRFMEHELPGVSRIDVFHQYLAQSYDPSIGGAIVSLDYTEDQIQFNPPFSGAAIGANPALLQDGIVYLGPSVLYTETEWATASLAGLTASDFETGGAMPDFSASGDVIHFGYRRWNANTSPGSDFSREHGIDNWSFSLTLVPTPTAGLMGLALLGGLAARRPRRRR